MLRHSEGAADLFVPSTVLDATVAFSAAARSSATVVGMELVAGDAAFLSSATVVGMDEAARWELLWTRLVVFSVSSL